MHSNQSNPSTKCDIGQEKGFTGRLALDLDFEALGHTGRTLVFVASTINSMSGSGENLCIKGLQISLRAHDIHKNLDQFQN